MKRETKQLPPLADFAAYLRQEERAPGTIQKYLRDTGAFLSWLQDRPLEKDCVKLWKGVLGAKGYAPVTINSMLAALHCYLAFADRRECRVSFLKIQRKLFRDAQRELTKEEYHHLVDTAAAQGKDRLALLLEAIGATGIRVSEVKYLTVAAAQQGYAEVALKGKIRTIFLPKKLCRKLKAYAKKQKIASGEIFLTRSGKGLSRCQIWAEMKALCRHAGIEASKVFPHNLRHLFAVTFYRVSHDVAKLADILGHSSIETTRLYLISTGSEHARQLNRLGMVS